jgi:glutaredoxin 3
MGRDFSPSEFYEKFGEGSSFPQVIFNETKIGGCSATLNYLKENEYL